MSITQYALNLGLLGYVLISNIGTHRISPTRLLLPFGLVVVAGAVFVRHPPIRGNDLTLELVGVAAGVVLGAVAGLLVRVRRDEDGRLVMRAGAAYAALWTGVIGGRVLFAYGAEHWFAASIGAFSSAHRITGADAWTAGFVLMALAMVLTRLAVTVLLAVVHDRSPVAVTS